MYMPSAFDYQKFSEIVNASSNKYQEQFPYPFMYFDGLFDSNLIDDINKEIDVGDFKLDEREIDSVEIKTRSDFSDNESIPKYSKIIFEILNGGKFLEIVTSLTGIKGLISDPYYDGGGINITKNNGTLAVHVDGTTQHRMNLCRRINAILFLNDNWDENWNGFHEQWVYTNKKLAPFDENQQWRCVRKIRPKKNRLVIFTTNDHSWHGHAGVLKVPDAVERRSLITYYYTSDRPGSDLVFDSPHRALFVNNKLTLNDEAFENVEIIL